MSPSPNSNSDRGSASFSQLDQRVQRWIWNSGWTQLRDAQERAIPLILAGKRDLIIAASTASGKTEAAFFPILTSLGAASEPSLAIYISPLKALINDQWGRLEELCQEMDLPVTPWHGDIPAARKTAFRRQPTGCLLITPESLEALLMRQGNAAAGLLAGLRYVVVDELHSFLGTERGKQLQSLLSRVEILLRRRVCRIGLSATLGEMEGAREFLRPRHGREVDLVETREGHQELQVLCKGLLEVPVDRAAAGDDPATEEPDSAAKMAVVADLFRVLRGSNNLIFPNSRSAVEYYADRLRRRSEEERVPNEFWPHHGNLAKDIREQTEAALKQRELPATAVCTSTLELGIDIGSVRSVAQIGPPPAVASLRQRLGRSGRRSGEPAILRCYVIERALTPQSSPSDLLRESLVQMVAMVQLLVRGWYEPVTTTGVHASTLVQQFISVLVQYGGLTAGQLWELLVKKGAFGRMPQELFASLLRELARREILFQDATGLILLAPKGERISEHYSFYAAFSSQEEFRVVASGRALGSIPVNRPLVPGGFLIFGGRRWRVERVSVEELVIEVQPAAGGALPSFEGSCMATLHDRVREEMREVLRGQTAVPFLDRGAADLLREARSHYRDLDLDTTSLRQAGGDVHLFLWKGDRIQDTIALLLQSQGIPAISHGLYLEARDTDIHRLRQTIERLGCAQFEATDLAAVVENKIREKWDGLLPNDVLDASFASENLDVTGAQTAMRRLCGTP
jgi:ATP-dependent Lhr-like helicase